MKQKMEMQTQARFSTKRPIARRVAGVNQAVSPPNSKKLDQNISV